MARRRRKGSTTSTESSDNDVGVRFEMEDDADEIFRRHVDSIVCVQGKEPEKVSNVALPPKRSRRGLREESRQLDLHGLTRDQAIQLCQSKIEGWLAVSRHVLKVKVITGKGRHSGPGGSILSRDIHDFVCRYFKRNLLTVESSPSDNLLNGLPIRGHFHVRLRRIRF